MTAEPHVITLRRTSADDAELIDNWRNQPSTLRFQASRKRSVEQIRELLAEHCATEIGPAASGRFAWMVLYGGEPAGHIQFTINGDYDRLHNNAALGYMVAESFQGRGIATTAVCLVSEIGFDPRGLSLERIEAVAATDNVGSQRVLQKSGFQLEGIRRKLLIISGVRVDHACYSRLAIDD